jgi:hypothetical protein
MSKNDAGYALLSSCVNLTDLRFWTDKLHRQGNNYKLNGEVN